MVFKRKATIDLPGPNCTNHTITIDAEDAERIQQESWKPYPVDQNRVTWLRNRGNGDCPAYELLEHFIMAARDNQFVEMVDRSAPDYRKSNLKARE